MTRLTTAGKYGHNDEGAYPCSRTGVLLSGAESTNRVTTISGNT